MAEYMDISLARLSSYLSNFGIYENSIRKSLHHSVQPIEE